MTVVLSINPILGFRGNLFNVARIFLIVRIRTSCSDILFILGGVYSNVIHKYIINGSTRDILNSCYKINCVQQIVYC